MRYSICDHRYSGDGRNLVITDSDDCTLNILRYCSRTNYDSYYFNRELIGLKVKERNTTWWEGITAKGKRKLPNLKRSFKCLLAILVGIVIWVAIIAAIVFVSTL